MKKRPVIEILTTNAASQDFLAVVKKVIQEHKAYQIQPEFGVRSSEFGVLFIL